MVALHAQKDGLRMVVILMPTKMNYFSCTFEGKHVGFICKVMCVLFIIRVQCACLRGFYSYVMLQCLQWSQVMFVCCSLRFKCSVFDNR